MKKIGKILMVAILILVVSACAQQTTATVVPTDVAVPSDTPTTPSIPTTPAVATLETTPAGLAAARSCFIPPAMKAITTSTC